MRFGIKAVLILVGASAVVRILLATFDIELPFWFFWLSLAIWMPIIVWVLVKVPGARKREAEQRSSALRQALQSEDRRSVNVHDKDER